MQTRKVLCLFNEILGNATMSRNIARALESMPGLEFDAESLRHDDYRKYTAPKLLRASNIAETSWVADRRFENLDFTSYDAVILGCFEFLWVVRRVLNKVPVVLFHDTTPVAARRLYAPLAQGFKQKFKNSVLLSLYKTMYAKPFSDTRLFFPRTPWCGRTLQEDFGVDEKRIIPTFTALDLEMWQAKSYDRTAEGKLHLLFVGNEFERKGGGGLLKVWDKLSETCSLTIVSGDPSLDSTLEGRHGIRLLRNVDYEEMPAVFREADVFVFPTLRDQLGIAATEAMASGLPVLARAVGGLPDIVEDGANGFLFSYESVMDDWVESILALSHDRGLVETMGRRARNTAEEKLGRDSFDYKVHTGLSMVLNGTL